MKKIGIITMNKVINYGSFLQAYAMKQILSKDGNEVFFIDFTGNSHFYKKASFIKKILNYARTICQIVFFTVTFNKKKRDLCRNFLAMKKLYNNFLKKTGKYWNNSQSSKESFDVVVIGSDEVFNYIDNSRVGYSDVLFGDGVNTKKLISFAACFGATTLEKLKENNYDKKIQNYLMKFDSISVRDKNSFEIVKELTGNSPYYDLDPVLHYGFEKEIVLKKHKKSYIIVYAYGKLSNEDRESIRQFAEMKNLNIYCIMGNQGSFGRLLNPTPFELLGLFKNASYVFTSTFHGCVLSVKYNKKFCVKIADGENNTYSNYNKVYDLIQRLGLEERILNGNLNEIMDKEIDYSKINDYIDKTTKSALATLYDKVEN